MSNPRETDRAGGSGRAGPGAAGWAVGIDRRLVMLCGQFGVGIDVLDPSTARFRAVPLGSDFNKPRSNLLLRRNGLGSGSHAYLDSDLEYRGSDNTLTAALAGSSRQNWRRLRLPPVTGSVNEAFCSVLATLGSPMARTATRVLQIPADTGPQHAAPREAPGGGRLLAAAGEPIPVEMVAGAYRASVRKPLARQLAVLTTRQAAPRAAVLWGPPGAGCDHLMLAAAAPLVEAGRVHQIYRLRGAMLAAGCVLAQELDALLMELLGEVASLDGCLLLVEDLDLCLSGSAVGNALLGGALDRGLRMLATARNPHFVRRLRNDPPLVRRLVPIRVAAPERAQTIEVLEELARAAEIDVTPPAIQAAARVVPGPDAVQPATAVGLLSAALAEAAWEGRKHVGPDDVVATLDAQWPKAHAAALQSGEEEEDDES